MTSIVTILLVDEEPILRRATAMLLGDRGGKVSAVASLGEAIALARQTVFDVAVVDVAPGGPPPAEVVQQLRERGFLPRRVVVCACPPIPSREALPFTAVLQKPYAFEHLLAAVFGPRSLRRPSSKLRDTRATASSPRRASAALLRGPRRAARARRGRV